MSKEFKENHVYMTDRPRDGRGRYVRQGTLPSDNSFMQVDDDEPTDGMANMEQLQALIAELQKKALGQRQQIAQLMAQQPQQPQQQGVGNGGGAGGGSTSVSNIKVDMMDFDGTKGPVEAQWFILMVDQAMAQGGLGQGTTLLL